MKKNKEMIATVISDYMRTMQNIEIWNERKKNSNYKIKYKMFL